MSDSPFIKFYPSDFLGGTSGLSPSERGVYITLLCLIFENEGPIPRDDSRLSRRCGAPKAAFVRILSSLIDEGKVTEKGGLLSNNRAEKALSDRQVRIKNATHAAHSKWGAQIGKTQQKQSTKDASAMPAHPSGICASDAIPEPELDIREEPKGSLSSGDDAAKPFDEIAECVSAYNEAAKQSGWPEVRVLSKSRRSALAQRLKECDGIDGWRHALAKAQDSPHCCGQNDRGWTANFDFLTRQSSFTKLMEGNYDNRNSQARNDQGRENRPDAAFEQALRLAGLGET